MIDRISPTQRPQRKTTGFQKWRDLLFLHWQVDAVRLQDTLPKGVMVDCYDGKAYLGVVPFSMEDVRPWNWVPKSAAFAFLECNVRTYVVCDGQPGVYFYSLDAASRLAVWAARTFWQLPYFNAQMQMQRQGSHVDYQVQRKGTQEASRYRYRLGAELGESTPGSVEHFLLERYLLFVTRYGQIQVGQVHHTPYPAFEVDLLECQDCLLAAAGFDQTQLAQATDAPLLCHYSPGVDVEIFKLRNVQTAW